MKLGYMFVTFYEAGTPFIKVKRHSATLVSKKRRNHKTVRFWSIFIFSYLTAHSI